MISEFDQLLYITRDGKKLPVTSKLQKGDTFYFSNKIGDTKSNSYNILESTPYGFVITDKQGNKYTMMQVNSGLNPEYKALQQIYDSGRCHTYMVCAVAVYGLCSRLSNVPEGYIITEYIGGGMDLFDVISKKQTSKWPSQKQYTLVYNLLCGLTSLHDLGIVIRDIKPENIIVRKDGNINYIDYSNACDQNDRACLDKVLVGTSGYWSPEIMRRNHTLSFEEWKMSDVWSLGWVIYAILQGQTVPWNKPVKAKNKYSQIDSDWNVFQTYKDGYIQSIMKQGASDPIYKILAGMIAMDPNERLTAEQAKEEVKSLLKYIPPPPEPKSSGEEEFVGWCSIC